jgi:hypothetical protein
MYYISWADEEVLTLLAAGTVYAIRSFLVTYHDRYKCIQWLLICLGSFKAEVLWLKYTHICGAYRIVCWRGLEVSVCGEFNQNP